MVPSNPGNFCPVTLEPLMCKILALFIRNPIYDFLCRNTYIETNKQNSFWTGKLGTIEQTESMSYLISHARLKQRCITISLLDLKNTFGKCNMNSYVNKISSCSAGNWEIHFAQRFSFRRHLSKSKKESFRVLTIHYCCLISVWTLR